MGLTQLNFEGKNKVEVAIMRLQEFEPEDGYYLAFGGGKDSVVIYKLALAAGVKFDAHYHVSMDPPELVKFIRSEFPDVSIEKSGHNFWQLIVQKGFPLRKRRWCCEYFKEFGGEGRGIITGVRWAESIKRRGRRMVETSFRKQTRFNEKPPRFIICPIIDWSTSEVWEYIRTRKVSYCSLYDEGAKRKGYGGGYFKRLGCVMCPMTSVVNARREYERHPKIAQAYRSAFNRLYEAKKDKYSRWESGDEMFEWWLSGGHKGKNELQCEMFT